MCRCRLRLRRPRLRLRSSASFDVLEAGDMVEGCSIGFRFGLVFEPVRNFLPLFDTHLCLVI